MTNILEFREWIKKFYSRFSLYILAAIKFVVMFVISILINNNIGYMSKLKSPVVGLVLSMVCAFLPANVILMFSAVLILVHLYYASIPLAAIIFVMFLIITLVYFRFSPKYAYALLLTPVAFALKIPYVVPIILGLVATPVSMVPVFLGGIVFFLIQNIAAASSTLLRAGDNGTIQAYLLVMENTIKSSQMYLVVLTSMITILVVYIIKIMSIDHSWTISIVTGMLLQMIVYLIGDFVFDISTSIIVLIVNSVLSFIIAFVIQFFVFSVDYSRTEYVQFEDDEYYYYVKAVPKLAIAKREKEVKHINSQHKIREDKRKK